MWVDDANRIQNCMLRKTVLELLYELGGSPYHNNITTIRQGNNMYMQTTKMTQQGRARILEHSVFKSSTIAANASHVMGSILPDSSFLRLAYMLLPLTTNARCSASEFKSNKVGFSGSFNTQQV